MTESGAPAPKVFVSYSWDNEDHRSWVRNFAARLRGDGVDATLDQWNVRLGDPLTQFMEESIRDNDFVLIICTPGYKDRSDGRIGGAGYEGDIMTAEVYTTRNHRKFIPVLCKGDWNSAPPSWLSGKRGVDLRGESYSEDEYRILVQELHGLTPRPPALGPRPSYMPESATLDYADVAPSPADVGELERARSQLEMLPLEEVPDRAALPSGSVMPLRPNRHFVGREEQLREIATNLKAGHATTVSEVTVAASSGLGGIGKTQLASEFVHRYGQFFHGVYWLSFADPNAVPAEIAFCGDTGGMNLSPGFHGLPLDERVRAVMAEWQSELPRLLVFDNCEDEDLLDRWLPSSGGCRVLVTSRRGRWGPALGVIDLPLDVLDRRKSIELLQKYRPDLTADDSHLYTIAEELGDLPLALDLAGRYLDRYRREVEPVEYLEEIRRPELLEHPSLRQATGISPTKHDLDVWRTFAISYQRLDAEDETDRVSMSILARSARLAPGELIPIDLLWWTLESPDNDELTSPTRGTTVDRDALDSLTRLGLLEDLDAETLRMHRLVAAFSLAEISDDEAQEAAEMGCARAVGRAFREGHPARQEALLPHVRFMTDLAMSRADAMAASLCTALGLSLSQLMAYDEALPYAERAWEISVELYGPEHHITLQRHSNVGQVLEANNDRVRARTIYQEVLEAQERVLGQQDPDVAATLNNLGASFARDDLYHKTLSAYRRALRIREDVWEETPPEDPNRGENAYELAESQGNMGQLLMDLGRYEEAGGHLMNALNILTDEVELAHERNAGTLVTLGRALRAQRKPIAVPTIESALKIYTDIGRTYSAEAVRALANVGFVYMEWAEQDQTLSISQRNHNLDQANGALHGALNGAQVLYGEDHPATGGILQVLARVCDAQGDTTNGREYREQSEANRRTNFELEDADPAHTLAAHGTSLIGHGLYDEAYAYLERALTLRENALGEQHFDTSTSLLILGALSQLRGHDNEARECLQRTLAIRSHLCGEDHAATELVRENLRLLDG